VYYSIGRKLLRFTGHRVYVCKLTLREGGRETARWNKFHFMWSDDKELQVEKWAAASSLMPDAFDKRFYFFT